MAGKALNKKNLVALGADALADLLLEAVKGDAARQRKVRMALAATQTPQDAAAELRKRFASIRRAKSYISRRTQKSLAPELTGLISMVETGIAPNAPDLGFDLLWSLLHLAPSIYERTDDSQGTIGNVMDDAMAALGRLAGSLSHDPGALADTVFEALSDNGYGQFDHVIAALADALGDAGLARLKALAEAGLSDPLPDAYADRYRFLDDPDERASLAKKSRDLSMKIILQEIADQRGDVDAWLSQYSDEQLSYATIAPDAARRLLEADRAEEALRIIEACLAREGHRGHAMDPPDLDEAHFACLEALGRDEDLGAALWARFERLLCVTSLRRFLKRLPDFEDDEALDQAHAHVMRYPSVTTALTFCQAWPDARLAAELILARSEDLDGDAYDVLAPAAEWLVGGHPLAAVVLWRAMIVYALHYRRTKRYGYIADHLQACATADMSIHDYGRQVDHMDFVQAIRAEYGHQQSFWRRVD